MTQIKLNASLMAHTVKMLMRKEPVSAHDVATETGLHPVTASEYLRELHRAKVVYIAAWQKDIRGRDCVKLFLLGVKPDAKRQKLDPGERKRRERDRTQARRELQVLAGKAQWVQAKNGRLRFEVLPGGA